jgi:Uma2 family endonuclease
MATTRLLTIADLAGLPDDGNEVELLRGEIIRMPPPKTEHGRITSFVNYLLQDWVRGTGLGAVYDNAGFALAHDPDTVLGPDVAFVSAAREKEVREAERQGRYPNVAPDLAVEVVSPSERPGDVHQKVLAYLDAGTRLVWLLYPRRRAVAVWDAERVEHLLGEGDVLDGGDVLPGFRVAVVDLFP